MDVWSEDTILDAVTCLSIVVPPERWEEFVARVRGMMADGANLWDAVENCAQE